MDMVVSIKRGPVTILVDINHLYEVPYSVQQAEFSYIDLRIDGGIALRKAVPLYRRSRLGADMHKALDNQVFVWQGTLSASTPGTSHTVSIYAYSTRARGAITQIGSGSVTVLEGRG
jgi:hypothetical protein